MKKWYLPYLVTKEWAWRKFNEVWNTELNFSREILGYQVRYALFFIFESVREIGKSGQSIHTSEVIELKMKKNPLAKDALPQS